jgi:hypothetical protein
MKFTLDDPAAVLRRHKGSVNLHLVPLSTVDEAFALRLKKAYDKETT